MRVTLLILYLLCVPGRFLQAQTNDAVFQLSLKNGLPSNHIYISKVDAHGYLWLGTDAGLVKYNGYSCRVFTKQDGLPANDVINLMEDSKGRMWVFTMSNDVGYMADDRYHSAFGNKKPGRDIRTTFIVEYRGDVYFNSTVHNDSVSIYRYDQAGRIWEWARPEISSVALFLDAREYITFKGDTACSYDFPFKSGFPEGGKYNCLYVHFGQFGEYGHKNVFVINTISGDALRIKAGKNDFYVLRHRKGLKRYSGRLAPFYYNSTGFSETPSWGVYLYYKDSILLVKDDTVIVPFARNAYGSNLTRFIDRDGLRYYGTRNEGHFLHARLYFHPVPPDISFPAVRCWENNYSGTSLLSHNASRQVPGYSMDIMRSYDGQGKMLLGTGNVVMLDRSGRAHSVWQGIDRVFLPWFKSSPQKDGYWWDPSNAEDIAHFKYTCAALPDSTHFYFSGTRGFFKIRRNSDSVALTRINSTRFNYMCYDSSLHLLIAYNDNLLCLYHTKSEKQVLYKTDQLAGNMPEGLERIYILGNGRYLIKSHELLLLYDVMQHRVDMVPHSFSIGDGLVAVTGGRLFAAGRFGVASIPLGEMRNREHWKVLPNFKGKDYKKVYDLVVTDTAVLLGTDAGVWSVKIQELYRAPQFAGDSLFNLFVRGDSINRVRTRDTLVFSQELSRLSLDASNMYGTGTLSFRYRLDELNGAFAGTAGDIYVGDMKPGRYYPFTVIAVDDAWQSRPLTVYLYRRPYWYQTQSWIKAFWIGGVFLFLLFVGGVILLTRYFVERKNAKKQQLIELELRALYSQINPHFIFNSLNSAQYFINARDIDKAYDHVSKFARLLRAYLKSSHDRYVTIAEEVNMLHNYVELQQERFREPFSYSIKVDNKIPKDSIQIPSLLLQPLVENAINHGLFHKKGQGHLSIEFLQGHNHEEIVCIIEDDGIGREKAKEISKANAASRYGSYGTKLTEQLIGIFERYEQMNISVTYTDKKSPQSGTIVTLTIRNVRYVA